MLQPVPSEFYSKRFEDWRNYLIYARNRLISRILPRCARGRYATRRRGRATRRRL